MGLDVAVGPAVTPPPRPPTRVLAAFALLALAFCITVAWAIVRERSAEWRRTEAAFEQLPGTPGRRGRDVQSGVQQIWLPDLDRVDRCTTCHRGIDDAAFAKARQPFTTHPGSWIAAHPAERFGCTPCHGGQGEATTWRGAAHRPLLYFPIPMRRGAMIEAGCGTCHRERHPAGANVLASGRDAIARAGCAGCHDIPGFSADETHAPRLESVGWKAQAGWLRRYLAQPSLVAGARMPDFRLTPAELDALDAFLRGQRATPPLDSGAVDWSKADPERGRELYARARCVTCHRVDERGGTLGPDLSHVGSRVTREWLWSYLTDPFRDQPDTLMPRVAFKADEIRDITSYLAEDLVDPEAPATPEPAPLPSAAAIDAGRKVFVRRGCFGCHRLAGTERLAKIGPALAGIGDRAIEPADFRGARVEASLANWLYLKLRAPQDLTTASSMPTFAIADQERASIVIALLSLVRRDPPASRVTGDPAPRPWTPQGEVGAIVARYRCLSCHEAQGTGGRLSTVSLDRIGSQLQPVYLAAFLREPGAVRVSLDVRMPRMHMTEHEVAVLADYARRILIDDRLATWTPPAAGEERTGAVLYERLGCRACHTIARVGGYVGPDLTAVGRRLEPGWIAAWLAAPSRWKPGTLQPDYGLRPDQVTALTAYLMTLTHGEPRR